MNAITSLHLLLVHPGLHIDPNNQQMKTALNDALSAKKKPPAGGGLFGPDALMRLAMDSRTRHLMDDKVGVDRACTMERHTVVGRWVGWDGGCFCLALHCPGLTAAGWAELFLIWALWRFQSSCLLSDVNVSHNTCQQVTGSDRYPCYIGKMAPH